MAKRVSSFVISPMGDDDGSVRYTIENVWTNIIYPAKAIAERKTGYQTTPGLNSRMSGPATFSRTLSSASSGTTSSSPSCTAAIPT